MARKKSKRYLWWLLAGLVAATALILYFNREESPDIEYRFDQVRRGDISRVVTATGALEAVTTVQVGSQVSGTIARLYADYNTIVRAGDVVAEIDPTFLDAQVKENEANLQRLLASEKDAQRNLARTRELYDKGVVSDADRDAAVTAYEVAKASRLQSEAALDRARVNRRYATIRSPIDGVVISRNVDVGQTVAASLQAPTLFQIANDLTQMQVKASIDEADIGMIRVGQPVTFTVDAYGTQTFSGRISEIRLEPINTNNVISYDVIVDVPNPDLQLMPGMTANITVLIERRENVLRVPALALRFRPPEGAELVHPEDMQKTEDTGGATGPVHAADSVKAGSSGTASAEATSSSARPAAGRSAAIASPVEGRRSDRGEGSMQGGGAMMQEFAGMSREQIREKFQNMSPEERAALRERFMQRRGGSWNPGSAKNVETFDRMSMMAPRDVPEGRPAVPLTKKWSRSNGTSETAPQPGRVWVMDGKGRLRAIPVMTGVSDGTFTEIRAKDLKEGDRIVVSAMSSAAPQMQNSPLGPPRRGF
jgi:HlyD family secretion protein